jgi:hypothetical protein
VASSVVVYDGRLLDLEVARMSILCVMVDLVLGWGLLLASHILASRTAGSGEAEHATSLGSSEEGAVSVTSVPLPASK